MKHALPSLLLALPLACAAQRNTAASDTDDTTSSDASSSESTDAQSSGADTTGTHDTTGDDSNGDDPTSDDGSNGDDGSTGDDDVPAPTVRELWREQAPEGSADAVCVRPDGSVILAGSTSNPDHNGYGYLAAFGADGRTLWHTMLDEAPLATVVREVACAPDGSIYVVGLRGDDVYLSWPMLARVSAEGTVMWTEQVIGSTQEGEFTGVLADADGAWVVGMRDPSPESFVYDPILARYDADGTQAWWTNAPIAGRDGQLRGIARTGDTLVVAGEAFYDDETSFDRFAFAAGFSLDGDHRWTADLGAVDSDARHVAVDPTTGEAIVAGVVELEFNDERAWTMRCGEDGCAKAEELIGLEVHDIEELVGFAVDDAGRRIASANGETVALAGDGDAWWRFDSEVEHVWSADRSVLAVGEGVVYTAIGEDPPMLVAIGVEE